MTARPVFTHLPSDIPVSERESVKIEVVDEPGPGGANHHYWLLARGQVTSIRFQKGAIQEAGVNGVTNEALLAVVKDRLECFQRGPFPCKENAKALRAVDKALRVLHERTADRISRGVEGKTEA